MGDATSQIDRLGQVDIGSGPDQFARAITCCIDSGLCRPAIVRDTVCHQAKRCSRQRAVIDGLYKQFDTISCRQMVSCFVGASNLVRKSSATSGDQVKFFDLDLSDPL